MSSAATPSAPATTFAGLWNDLKAEATAAWAAVKADAAALEANIVPTIESDVATVLSQFKTVAVNTVMSLATTEMANLTGTQKSTITANTIVQAALASGKTIAVQDAQMLAQQAFQAVATTVGAAK